MLVMLGLAGLAAAILTGLASPRPADRPVPISTHDPKCPEAPRNG